MRMWMVDPHKMCRQHLLGEHVEIHMLAGSLLKGRSIKKFLTTGLLEPQSMRTRHAELVNEMNRRGYQHASPLPVVDRVPSGAVDRTASAVALAARCPKCATLRETAV